MVLNKFTHEPIGRAVVYSPDERFATLSDDEGRFEFKVPHQAGPRSTFTSTFSDGDSTQQYVVRNMGPGLPGLLLARKIGFLPSPFTPTQIAENGVEQTLVTLLLTPESLVIAHVALPSPDDAQRIQVELYRRKFRQGAAHWELAGSKGSRADGSVRFAGLAAGDYKLLTRGQLDRDPLSFDPRGKLFGYAPVYYPSAGDFESAEVIHLKAGGVFQGNLSVTRREYSRLKVAVQSGTAVSQLEVWPQGRPGPGYSVFFNASEQAINGALPEGTYTVRARSFGTQQMSGATNITVGNAPISEGSLLMVPDAAIPVTIHDELQNAQPNGFSRGMTFSHGKPGRANYCSVMLVPINDFGLEGTPSMNQAIEPDDQSLFIRNVLPGVYRVRATAFTGYIAAITSGGVDLLRLPLVVGSGSTPPAIEITMRDDGAQVEGKLDDPAGNRGVAKSGSASTNVPVYFFPKADGPGQYRMVWAGGERRQFEVEQLPPGDYRVLALDHEDSSLEFASEETLSRYGTALQEIRVSNGEKAHLQLHVTTSNP